jgi:hypothetical protein
MKTKLILFLAGLFVTAAAAVVYIRRKMAGIDQPGATDAQKLAAVVKNITTLPALVPTTQPAPQPEPGPVAVRTPVILPEENPQVSPPLTADISIPVVIPESVAHMDDELRQMRRA